jgi:hypothetical protein
MLTAAQPLTRGGDAPCSHSLGVSHPTLFPVLRVYANGSGLTSETAPLMSRQDGRVKYCAEGKTEVTIDSDRPTRYTSMSRSFYYGLTAWLPLPAGFIAAILSRSI